MDAVTIGMFSIVVMFALVLAGVHVGVVLGIVSVGGLWLASGSFAGASNLVASTFYAAVKDYVFGVVPLFIMVGVVLSKAEMSQDLFEAAKVLLGRVRGGLAMATVAANAVFAAIVGSSIASAAAFSKISFEPMTSQGYDRKFSLGTVAGSSVLGMLIPPSLLFIIYGIITGASIGRMFMAGIMPGLLLSLIYVIGIAIMVKVRPNLAPLDPPAEMNRGKALKALLKPWHLILLIVLVLGGIYGGLFTPTEAGAVGLAGSLIIGFALRRLDFAKFKEIVIETGVVTGSVFFLLITAQLYSRMVALTGVVDWLNRLLVTSGLPIMVIIILFLVLVFCLGAIIDSTSILLLTMPVILPILNNFGVDLIWFGIIMVVTVEMGLITPPFGMSVFTVKASLGDRVSLEEIFGGSIPFLLMMITCLVLLIVFPRISTWLPSLM